MLEVDAFEQLHHDERRAVRRATDIGHSTDVLRSEMDDRARLAQEPVDDGRVADHLVAQELDGNAMAELEMGRRNHDAHPAGSEDRIDPEPATDNDAHRGGHTARIAD